MKVKYIKLKKSIFLILICISLTTTFVVSASAVYSNYDAPVYSVKDPNNIIYSLPIYESSGSTSIFCIVNPSDSLIDIQGVSMQPFSSALISSGTNDLDFVGSDFSYIIFDFVIESITLTFEGSFSDILYPDDQFFGAFIGFSRVPIDDLTLGLSYSSDNFTDIVGSGLTSSLNWVGQVVESLTTGPIKPLLECLAVTISVSVLLLGIYSIRRFIWGS